LGIEIIDASEFIGERVEFAFPDVSYAFEDCTNKTNYVKNAANVIK